LFWQGVCLTSKTDGETWEDICPGFRSFSNLRLQYTIGFSPSDPGAEGSFHRLTVKFASDNSCPACRLLARKGYYSGISASQPALKKNQRAPDASPLQADPYMLRHLICAAGTVDFDLPDIPIVIKASRQKGPDGKRHIEVGLHIDVFGVEFRTVENRHRFKLYIAIFFLGPGATEHIIWREEWREVEGMLKEETHEEVLKNGVTFFLTIPVVPHAEVLRIVAYDEGSETLGSRTVSVP
jgi:hypothetical protein